MVGHKDRLRRFEFGNFELRLTLMGWEWVVINRDGEVKDDRMKDLMVVVTSFGCRWYETEAWAKHRVKGKRGDMRRACKVTLNFADETRWRMGSWSIRRKSD